MWERVLFYTALIPKRRRKCAGASAMKPIRLITVCLALLSACLGAAASAATVPDLYEETIPVGSSRDAAFVEALKNVAVRVSGRRDAPVRLEGKALANPRQYVQRFGFTADNLLQVGFDSVSVDQMLTDAGLPVWGRERPLTLVLLNIATGSGTSYLLDSAANSPVRDIVVRTAAQRGLPIIWPDPAQGLPQTGGDAASLMQTAAGYGANAALVGTARSDGAGGWSVQWQLASPDANTSTNGSIEDGVHLAADAFARIYSASGTTLDSVIVQVSDINDLAAYANTLNYLEGLTLVRGVSVEQVTGSTMRFRVAVRGDAATLRRALSLDGRLVAIEPGAGAVPTDRLLFRYQP